MLLHFSDNLKLLICPFPRVFTQSARYPSIQPSTIYLFLCVHVSMYVHANIYVWVHTHHSTHMEDRGQLAEVGFLLPTSGAQRKNSGHQTWRLVLSLPGLVLSNLIN